MLVHNGLSWVGFSLQTIPGLSMFGLAFLISTLWSAFVRYRSAARYLLCGFVLATNLPALLFAGSSLIANDQPISSSFGYATAYVLLYSGGLGIGSFVGSLFGLLIRIGAVGVRDALQ
jgi:hypothetical protein